MPRKGKSGKPLPTVLVAEMREDYVREQNLLKIARKYKVHHQTVRKYCRLDRWDDYVAKVKARADELAIERGARRTAKHVILLDGYLAKQAKALAGQNVEKFSIGGADKAIRCIQLLLGEQDSRGSGVGDSIEDIVRAIDRLTTGEVERAIKLLADSEGKSRRG